jgi:hypothetical protein
MKVLVGMQVGDRLSAAEELVEKVRAVIPDVEVQIVVEQPDTEVRFDALD